jgi:signal transduction histidine kinase
MTIGTPHPLRQRAEAILRERGGPERQLEADALRLQHELQVYQVELEMQDAAVRQTQADIEEARRRTDTAVELAAVARRAKSTFLSTVSHELRTPLHQVLGDAVFARAGQAGESDNLHRGNLGRLAVERST